MRFNIAKLLVVAALVAVPTFGLIPDIAHSAGAMPQRANWAPTEDPSGARVIVKYKALGPLMRAMRANGISSNGPQHAATLAQRIGLGLRNGRIVDGQTQVVRGDKTLSSAALAARLAADPDVEFAVPDLRRHVLLTPNDPLYLASASISPAAGQWYLRPADSTFVSAINAAGAWDITTGSSLPTGIVVADIDTGVLFNHPDLTAKLYPGYDFSTDTNNGDGDAVDANASDPGDATAAGECGSGEPAQSSSWHGTQVASLIGAQTNNSTGMASVGFNVMVLPVRALGKCGGFDSDIVAGMLWAGGVTNTPGTSSKNPHPAKVINLSLGSSGACGTIYTTAMTQLTAAKVVVVAAAGNDEGLAVGTPANCPGVIAVAGVRHAGTKVGFSDIGPEVAISAPAGNCVNTTGTCLYPIIAATNTGTTTPATNTYSTSGNPSFGTSFASPLVAGTAALMLSVNPNLTPAQVKNMLQSSARPFPSTVSGVPVCQAPSATIQDECNCTTSTCGAGLLDAAAATAAAAGTSLTTAIVTPSATTVTAGASVTFDGTGSTASNGHSISSYQWTFTSNTVGATFGSGTTGSSATVITPAAAASGSFTVRLLVTDNVGVSASKSVSVNVNAAAAPALSLLSSASVVAAGSSVSFDGSGTTAAAGLSIVSYQWAIISGATLASFTTATNGPTAAVLTNGAGSGTFTIQLTVTDSAGRSSSSSTTVSVTALGPTASVSASPPSVTAGNGIIFSGTGSSAPAGRTIASYQWTLTGGSAIAAINGAGNGSAVAVTTSGAGTVTVQLTVTDSAGVSASATGTAAVLAATSSASSSGGGGALGVGWLVLLLSAVLALAVAARLERRRAALSAPARVSRRR
jgi:serine protease